jgi:putative membrane protein
MQLSRARIVQVISVFVVQVIALIVLAWLLPGFQIDSLASAIGVLIAYSIAQAAIWLVFIHLLSWLPTILYPILTFALTGATVAFAGNFVPGIRITNAWAGLGITIGMTIVDAILGSLLSLDEDAAFDRNVTRKIVAKRGHPIQTDVPGFLFLEIDGLAESIFRRALEAGHMPTLKSWLDKGSHCILGWETDFTAQTGAMQTGILLGNNDNVPAYRWWDRQQGKIIMSGNPRDAKALEARLTNHRGLLADGGASRGNMFSGDASESMLTFSRLLDRSQKRGPGLYLYLFSPYVIVRLLTRYFIDVVKEIFEASQQRHRKDKYIVSARNVPYAFFRALMGPILQDLTTYTVINDALRGVPAVYALFAAYDDVSHFAGSTTPEAFEVLEETDRYFARIERALQYAPRPYHIVVLSDHGQSTGPTFKKAYGVSLEELVKGLIKGDEKIFASLDTNEAWDNLNALLSESTNANTRTAGLVKMMLASKTREDGEVAVGPDRDAQKFQGAQAGQDAKVVVMGSGCTGLIYFTDSKTRMTYEQIQQKYPELMIGLMNHPGVGFLLVQSEKDGALAVGKHGVHYLDHDKVEGKQDPLAPYGPNAAMHLKRETSFVDCPDIIVNSVYDPQTQELPGFENQVSHHGGLGGPQNHAFIYYPAQLPYDGKPIVQATSVYRLLHGWREQVQNQSGKDQPEPMRAAA